MSQTVIRVQNLKKQFADHAVLNGIDLEIAAGDLTVLIGPSGCGKSTLLRCLNGLEIFDAGTVDIVGYHLERRHPVASLDREYQKSAQNVRRHVGMVFQSFNLFPHMNLIENVMCAPRVVNGVSKNLAEEQGMSLLKKVGLHTHAKHYPLQMSGGQQQRGAIARALAMSPKIMLYDEPTSALDPSLTGEVWQVMKKLDEEGMTQIVVTHEHRVARDVADRVVFLDHGQVIEDAAPDILFGNPKDERTREFLRHSF